MVVGLGGIICVVVYVFYDFGYLFIYIVVCSLDCVKVIVDFFFEDYNIQILFMFEEVKVVMDVFLMVVISSIFVDKFIDQSMCEVLVVLLRYFVKLEKELWVLLEMVYMFCYMLLMQLVEDVGWKMIFGLEVLVVQGWYQVCFYFVFDIIIIVNMYISFNFGQELFFCMLMLGLL